MKLDTMLYFDPITDVCIGYLQENDKPTKRHPYANEAWADHVGRKDKKFCVEGEYDMPSIRVLPPIGRDAQSLLLYARRRTRRRRRTR